MKVKKVKFEPTYTKVNGLFVIDLEKIELPFEVKEKSVVNIPPLQIGGNHKHPRIEAFVSLSNNLELVWIDGKGKKNRDEMKQGEKLVLFIIESGTPHAVINTSRNENGIMVEFASEEQKHLEKVEVVKFDNG